MKHLKIYEEYNERLESFFKDKIDWKLFRYIQGVLTEYWDKNISLGLDVYVGNYSIYADSLNPYEGDEQRIEEYTNIPFSDQYSSWWERRIEYYKKYKRLVYCIEYDDNGSIEYRIDNVQETYNEIKEKLNKKYHIEYYTVGTDENIQFSNYRLLIK